MYRHRPVLLGFILDTRVKQNFVLDYTKSTIISCDGTTGGKVPAPLPVAFNRVIQTGSSFVSLHNNMINK